MPTKKLANDLKLAMTEELARLLWNLNEFPTLFEKINNEILKVKSFLEDPEFWEHSATEPHGPNPHFQLYVWADKQKWNLTEARFYCFQNCVFGVLGENTEEQDKLLIQEAFDSERQKFERLKRKFAGGNAGDTKTSRQQIAEDVRIAVWRRDGGACARCGSRERLEYDHIVPVSRGGNNTVRNIELLCEVCNRSKSNHIQ